MNFYGLHYCQISDTSPVSDDIIECKTVFPNIPLLQHNVSFYIHMIYVNNVFFVLALTQCILMNFCMDIMTLRDVKLPDFYFLLCILPPTSFSRHLLINLFTVYSYCPVLITNFIITVTRFCFWNIFIHTHDWHSIITSNRFALHCIAYQEKYGSWSTFSMLCS